MSSRPEVVRTVLALLMVGLGLIIVGRGIVEGDPWSYIAMGALLAILGALRLGLFRRGIPGGP